MAPRKNAGAEKPKPTPIVRIPPGSVLTGVSYVSKSGVWGVGPGVGVGGFGVVLAASTDCDREVSVDDAPLVVKVEPFLSGPLFTEMHAMQRMCRPEYIGAWMKQRRLKFLGVPPLLGFGTATFAGVRYRFIVLNRYGQDVQKLFEESGRRLPTTVR